MPLFNVGELLTVAIKDEITGIAFYKALAAKTRLPHVASALVAISKQEERHKDRFARMLQDVGAYQPSETYTGEYDAYMRALLDTRAFASLEAAARNAATIGSDRDGLAMALRLENEALIFYNELRQLVPPTHEHYVEEVIREERDHLVEIARLMKTL